MWFSEAQLNWVAIEQEKLEMFWIFAAFALTAFLAIWLGQVSVWVTLLKFALVVAIGVIVVMGVALVRRRLGQKKDSNSLS